MEMTDHACLACGKIHGTGTAKLHDGRIVSTYSEDWRHECEAQSILKQPMPTLRRMMLNDIEKYRGKQTADALRKTVSTLFEQRKLDRAG